MLLTLSCKLVAVFIMICAVLLQNQAQDSVVLWHFQLPHRISSLWRTFAMAHFNRLYGQFTISLLHLKVGTICSTTCSTAQLMPLPLTVSCFSKIQIGFTLLVPAHLGSPGKRAVKRTCVCVCVCVFFLCLQCFNTVDRASGRASDL